MANAHKPKEKKRNDRIGNAQDGINFSSQSFESGANSSSYDEETGGDSNGAKLERRDMEGEEIPGGWSREREVRGQGATSKTMRYGPLE